jgi:putative Mg2+ transporter-C (MgtC) family protein
MIPFSQLLLRFFGALLSGAIVGYEREQAGKEAGLRTLMMVSGGSALFALLAIILPSLFAESPTELSGIVMNNAGFMNIIANIAVGIGFIGAGVILKTESHVHSLTTAAVIWMVAAIGIFAGLGLVGESLILSLIVAMLLYLLRNVNVTG